MSDMRLKLAPALIAPLLLLAGCEEEAAEVDTSATGGKAAGEILGGTISDDMLPLEELTSTSPPAERSPATSGEGEATDAGDEAAETPEAEAPSEAPAPDTGAEE